MSGPRYFMQDQENSGSKSSKSRRRERDRNTLATTVPRFNQSVYATDSSSTHSTVDDEERLSPRHNVPGAGLGLNLYGKNNGTTPLSTPLLPQSVVMDVAVADEKSKGARFSTANQDRINRERKQNSCSNNIITRSLRNQHTRGAFLTAINLIGLAIWYGTAVNRLYDDYSGEKSGTAKDSMIFLNAIGFTVYYWTRYLSWLTVLHRFASFYQDATAQDPIDKINEMYNGMLEMNEQLREQNDALRFFAPGSDLRKALESLSNLNTDVIDESADHVIKQLTEKVELVRDDNQELKQRMVALETKLDKVQTTVVTNTDLAAKQAKASFHRDVVDVSNFLAKANNLTTQINAVKNAFTKETSAGAQTVDSLDEKATPPNDYDLAYLVTQVLGVFGDTLGAKVSDLNCKQALDVLHAISVAVVNATREMPKVGRTRDALETSKLEGGSYPAIGQPKKLVQHVVEVFSAPEKDTNLQKSASFNRR